MRHSLHLAAVMFMALGLAVCRSPSPHRRDLGLVRYYRVYPRLPSVVHLTEEGRPANRFEPYVMIWGTIVADEVGDVRIERLVIERRRFQASSTRVALIAGQRHLLVRVDDPKILEHLPVDWGTGNLFAAEPSERKQVPIHFDGTGADGSTWNAAGLIEQSTMLELREVEERFPRTEPSPREPVLRLTID